MVQNLFNGRGVALRASRSDRARRGRVTLALVVAVGVGSICVPLAVRTAHAQTVDVWDWKSVNTQGMGYVTGVSISPQSPFDVYIRTDVGGAYRYDRGGEKWVPLMDMFGSNLAGGGIGVESIVADPSNNSRVYSAINYAYSTTTDQYGGVTYNYGGEILVSTNKGASWSPLGLATSGRAIYVGPNSEYRTTTGERIGVDPNKGDLLYFASSRDGLWKKDGTGAWAQVTGGLPTPSTLPGYYANGQSGSPNNNFPGYTFLMFDKSTGSSGNATQTLYLGVFGNGVYKSIDGGASWSLMGGSYAYPRRGALATDGTIYVSGGIDGNLKDGAGNSFANAGSVYRYKNSTWTEIRPGDAGSDYGIYTAVTVDPAAPGTVMVGRQRNVWRSTNHGTAWGTPLKIANANGTLNGAPGYYSTTVDADGGVAAMQIDPAASGTVWWVNGWGVARTENVTASPAVWTFRMKNLEELDANMVRVPPKAGGAAVWLATQDKIGFRLTSPETTPADKFNPNNIPTQPDYTWANGSWTVFPNPFPHVAGATGIDYAYNQPDHGAFVGFHQWQYQPYGPYQGIHGKTTDNGITWNAFASVPTENLFISWANATKTIKATAGMIAMSPTDPNRMVWAPSGGVWPHYTTDGGQSWSLCYNVSHGPAPSPYDANNMDHTHNQYLPKAWSLNISQWVSSAVLAADRADPVGKTFYYYTGFDFYYSTDGGVNWTSSQSNGILPDWTVRATVAPNPLSKGDVWLACARNTNTPTTNRLFRSVNGGQTFSVVAGVDSAEFIAFGKNATSPTQPTLYIWGRVGGATKDALYKTDNMGGSWVRISNPDTTQFPGITHLEGDMRTADLLYVSTTGRGFHYGMKGSTGGGSISREVWTGVSGTAVSNIPLSATPQIVDTLTSLEGPTNWAENYGTRIRGYLTAPTTGSYTFWVAGDDETQLFLSSNDQASNKIQIAGVSGWTNSREWGKYASQKSGVKNLTAGQKYYVEVLMKEATGGDNVAVGWSKPGESGTAPAEVVPGSVLSPFDAGAIDGARYNFETGTQGWMNAWGSATPSTDTAQKYAGTRSLAVVVNASGAGDHAVRVLNAGAATPMPGGGTAVTFRVYVPSTAAIDTAFAFSQDANWGNWGQSTVTLTKGQWNTITLTIPTASVSPLNAIGVSFHTTGAWGGTCYVDSVNW